MIVKMVIRRINVRNSKVKDSSLTSSPQTEDIDTTCVGKNTDDKHANVSYEINQLHPLAMIPLAYNTSYLCLMREVSSVQLLAV